MTFAAFTARPERAARAGAGPAAKIDQHAASAPSSARLNFSPGCLRNKPVIA
jgi:hypothetical protein